MTPQTRADLLRLVDLADRRNAAMERRLLELQDWIEGTAAAVCGLPAEERRGGRYAIAYHSTAGTLRKREGAAVGHLAMLRRMGRA